MKRHGKGDLGIGTQVERVGPSTADQRRDVTAYLIRTGNADLLDVFGLAGLGVPDQPRCRFCSDATAGGHAKTCGSVECKRLLLEEKRAEGRRFLRSTMGDTAYGVGR